MSGVTEVTPPTLDAMASVLPAYGARFDRTLASARSAIGQQCDPANPHHAEILRVWLNAWLCRIRLPLPEEDDPFVREMGAWWTAARQQLPEAGVRLADLTDAEISTIAAAFGDLEGRTAAVNRAGRVRTFGPTAAAKVLYFVRPLSVTAWDKAISQHVVGRGAAAFREHLLVCRAWARSLVAEAAERDIEPDDIGPMLGRPESSVAKLIDEWLYRTVTGGIDPTGAPATAD